MDLVFLVVHATPQTPAVPEKTKNPTKHIYYKQIKETTSENFWVSSLKKSENYRLMRSDYQNELLFRGSHVHLLSSGPPRPLLSGFPSFSLREIRYNSSADSHALMYCKLNNSV